MAKSTDVMFFTGSLTFSAAAKDDERVVTTADKEELVCTSFVIVSFDRSYTTQKSLGQFPGIQQ
ncbi:MAG: hypothetical protein UFA98_11780 [Ruminococcus sp.]|nr:hypothetical protein [Ruminococcus sp.]